VNTKFGNYCSAAFEKESSSLDLLAFDITRSRGGYNKVVAMLDDVHLGVNSSCVEAPVQGGTSVKPGIRHQTLNPLSGESN
jgi:hypothetical protein